MTCENGTCSLGEKTVQKVSIKLPDDNYGIKKYTKEQKDLHKDIQKLITTKYIDMSADDCMLVFARVYLTYTVAQLEKEGALCMTKQES